MKSFKNYQKEQVASEETSTAEELARKIASAYHGKSNADIMQGILEEAERSKRAGTLSNEELDAFFNTFSPMLDCAGRKKLRAVIERLKEI